MTHRKHAEAVPCARRTKGFPPAGPRPAFSYLAITIDILKKVKYYPTRSSSVDAICFCHHPSRRSSQNAGLPSKEPAMTAPPSASASVNHAVNCTLTVLRGNMNPIATSNVVITLTMYMRDRTMTPSEQQEAWGLLLARVQEEGREYEKQLHP